MDGWLVGEYTNNKNVVCQIYYVAEGDTYIVDTGDSIVMFCLRSDDPKDLADTIEKISNVQIV